MFTGSEAAVAYALSGERLFGHEADFLETNPACVPIFVSLLFQSLEISIKQAGLESGLFTEREARSRQQRSGHGITELAKLAVDKLGGDPFDPIIMAMTVRNKQPNSAEIISEMICGEKLDSTRESYASRCLGYGQVAEGDLAIIQPFADWVTAIKEVAFNLPTTIEVISRWRSSDSNSKHFAIWLHE